MADTLNVGENLSGEARITSADGRFTFGVMSDGNLVVGGQDGAEWEADIHDAPGARLDVQADGNVVLYREDGSPRWASDTSGENVRLVVQDDRNIVLYDGDGAVLWSPNSYNR